MAFTQILIKDLQTIDLPPVVKDQPRKEVALLSAMCTKILVAISFMKFPNRALNEVYDQVTEVYPSFAKDIYDRLKVIDDKAKYRPNVWKWQGPAVAKV